MQYCSKCGHQMEDGVQFCPQCGSAVNPSASPAPKGTRFHCPECGCHDLTPFVENSGAISGMAKMDASRSWICKNCGNMFRHPDDVIKEAKQKTKRITFALSLPFGCLALFSLLLSAISGESALPTLLILALGMGGIIFMLRCIEKSQLKKAEELRKACLE